MAAQSGIRCVTLDADRYIVEMEIEPLQLDRLRLPAHLCPTEADRMDLADSFQFRPAGAEPVPLWGVDWRPRESDYEFELDFSAPTPSAGRLQYAFWWPAGHESLLLKLNFSGVGLLERRIQVQNPLLQDWSGIELRIRNPEGWLQLSNFRLRAGACRSQLLNHWLTPISLRPLLCAERSGRSQLL